MKKLMCLFTGFMMVSLISYSNNNLSTTSLLDASPAKGYYSIGNVYRPGGKRLILASVYGGKKFVHTPGKGYYAIGDNGKKSNRNIYLLPAVSKKAVIRKGYYSQVH